MNINQHVVKRERGWAVLGEGNQRDTVVLPTRTAAIAKGAAIAERRGSKLIVHPPLSSDVQRTVVVNDELR